MKEKATRGGAAHFGILNHFKAIERVREGLKKALQECPGPSKESGITMLSPRCGTVRFGSMMNGSWSAETYLFPVQYEALSKLVDKSKPENIIPHLLQALKSGRVRLDFNPGNSIPLHPEVVANVRKMLKETV